MIAHAKPVSGQSIDAERQFISILPTIQSAAEYAFRRLASDEHEEAVQEVLASAYVAFARLAEQGRACQAFGSTLGGYAVAQYRSGRRVGSRMNSADVMAPGQRRFRVERLDDINEDNDDWRATGSRGYRSGTAGLPRPLPLATPRATSPSGMASRELESHSSDVSSTRPGTASTASRWSIRPTDYRPFDHQFKPADLHYAATQHSSGVGICATLPALYRLYFH